MRMGEPIRELLHYSIGETISLDGNLERTVRDHQAIYRAICAGDASGARDAMRVHLETTAREVTGKIGQASVA
jgi:DNA-binding FadR family transcriptional regulator